MAGRSTVGCVGGRDDEAPVASVHQSLQSGSDASFVSTNFPPLLSPGERRLVQVVMRKRRRDLADQRLVGGRWLCASSAGGAWGWVYRAVNSNVAVGGNHAFNFLITAPAAPGNYGFGAQMRVLSDAFFGDVVNVHNIVVDPAQPRMWDCTLVSTTIPSNMAPGQRPEKGASGLKKAPSGAKTADKKDCVARKPQGHAA